MLCLSEGSAPFYGYPLLVDGLGALGLMNHQRHTRKSDTYGRWLFAGTEMILRPCVAAAEASRTIGLIPRSLLPGLSGGFQD
jgi:hypothetical protein